MVRAISFSSQAATFPTNLTITDSKPISVRIAKENEIDEINRSPQAKKLYNAQLIGGAVGVGLAAIGSTIAAVVTKKTIGKEMPKLILALGALGTTIAASIPFATVGAKAAKVLTVFTSTRGDKSEKV